MKARMSIRSIIMVMAIIGLLSMFFINISFATNTGKIKTETARLREQPQTDSKVLDLASIGDEVEILEEVEDWYKVKYKNITGYIRTDLVEVKNKEENVVNNEETKNVETESTTENTQVENNLTSENEIVENSNTETNATEVQEKVTIEKGKYKVVNNVKLKIIPLISAIEFNEISKDAEIEVIEVLNDWAKIKSADGKEGWIRIEKLVTIQDTNSESDNNKQNEKDEQTKKVEDANKEENTATTEKKATQETTKTMYVNSKTVNLRQKADKTAQVVKQLSINTQVTVISTGNGWAYVDINGTKGYIAENLLSSSKQETSRGTMTERNTTNNIVAAKKTENTASKSNTATTANKSAANNSSSSNSTASQTGSSVVSYAKKFLGCKYVYGGATTSGFDCSGFTQYVYKHFGVSLNRTAAAQYSNGTAVKSLQAGDLVMFGKSGINHVGIYIGGNTFIHAENPSKGVTTTSLSSSYYKTNYVGARRIF